MTNYFYHFIFFVYLQWSRGAAIHLFDVVKAGKSTSTFSQQSSILSKVLSESAQDIQTASLYFSTLVLSRFHFIPCKDPPKIFKRFHFIFQLRLKFSYYLHSNRAVRGLGGLEQPQRHLCIKFVENFHNLKHYHFVKLAKWVGDRESSLKTNMNFDPSIKLICETAKYFNRSKHHQQLLSDFVLEIRIDKLMTKMCFVIKISNIFTISKKSAQKWTMS